jgi:hypothetical protein
VAVTVGNGVDVEASGLHPNVFRTTPAATVPAPRYNALRMNSRRDIFFISAPFSDQV